MKKLFPVVALLCLMIVVFGCKKPEPEPGPEPGPGPDPVEDVFGILSFSLTMPSGQTLECTVDQDAKTIVNDKDPLEPGMPASQYIMKMNYTATLETTVKYNGAALESGVTTADFSAPVTVTAVKGEKEISYTVTVIEDPNDASQTSGKRVNSDMTGSGFPQAAWFDIAFFKGAFFAITATYPDGTSAEDPALYDVYKSEDGISWTKVNTSINVTGAYGAKLVVFNDKLFAYGGGRFYGTDEDGNAPEEGWSWTGTAPDITKLFLSYTEDGENWTAADNAELMGWHDPQCFAQGDKFINLAGLMCAYGSFMFSYMVSQSTDGVTWEMVPEFDRTSAATRIKCGALYSFKGNLYLAGGFTNFVSDNNIQSTVFCSSDGGLNWTEATADGGFGKMWNMRVAGTDDVLYMVGGEYFEEVAGEDGSSTSERRLSNKVYRSTDGVSWTPLEGENAMPDNYVGRARPCLVADGNMLWIFGGRGESTDTYAAPVATDEVIFDTWKKKIK